MNWAIAEPHLQLEVQRSSGYLWFTMGKPDGSYYNTGRGAIRNIT